jgi:hypothetical protein
MMINGRLCETHKLTTLSRESADSIVPRFEGGPNDR